MFPLPTRVFGILYALARSTNFLPTAGRLSVFAGCAKEGAGEF